MSELPMDCWCVICEYLDNSHDFKSLTLTIKGFLHHIKTVNPIGCQSICFKMKNYIQIPLSHVHILAIHGDLCKHLSNPLIEGIVFSELALMFPNLRMLKISLPKKLVVVRYDFYQFAKLEELEIVLEEQEDLPVFSFLGCGSLWRMKFKSKESVKLNVQFLEKMKSLRSLELERCFMRKKMIENIPNLENFEMIKVEFDDDEDEEDTGEENSDAEEEKVVEIKNQNDDDDSDIEDDFDEEKEKRKRNIALWKQNSALSFHKLMKLERIYIKNCIFDEKHLVFAELPKLKTLYYQCFENEDDQEIRMDLKESLDLEELRIFITDKNVATDFVRDMMLYQNLQKLCIVIGELDGDEIYNLTFPNTNSVISDLPELQQFQTNCVFSEIKNLPKLENLSFIYSPNYKEIKYLPSLKAVHVIQAQPSFFVRYPEIYPVIEELTILTPENYLSDDESDSDEAFMMNMFTNVRKLIFQIDEEKCYVLDFPKLESLFLSGTNDIELLNTPNLTSIFVSNGDVGIRIAKSKCDKLETLVLGKEGMVKMETSNVSWVRNLECKTPLTNRFGEISRRFTNLRTVKCSISGSHQISGVGTPNLEELYLHCVKNTNIYLTDLMFLRKLEIICEKDVQTTVTILENCPNLNRKTAEGMYFHDPFRTDGSIFTPSMDSENLMIESCMKEFQ